MSRIIFDQLVTAPQAVVQVDDSGLNGINTSGSGTLVIVGRAFGGQPSTPLRFTSASRAAAVLGSGELVSAIQRAFSPGSDIPGAPVVLAVRVNKGTQSLLDLTAGTASALATPTAPTLTASATGGSLLTGNYNYRIAAINGNGSTLASPEAGAAAAVTGPNGSVDVNWTEVPSATGYKIYGRTAGGELLLATVAGGSTTQFTDDGSLIPAGALPGANTTAGALTAVALTSLDYGAQTRQVRVKVEAAGGGVGNKLTVQYGTAINSKDNVFRKAISVALLDTGATYTGATIAVAGNTLTLVLTPTVGQAATIDFDLTIYPTLQAVVDGLNNVGDGIAAAVTSISGSDPSTILDEISATNIRITNAQAAPTQFYANNRACLDFFNKYSGFVSAVAGSTRRAPDATAGYVYLGSDSAAHQGTDYGRDGAGHALSGISVQDWSDALDSVLTVDCSVITVASPDSTIHALLQAHVDQASSTAYRMERVGVVGGDAGETVAETIARAGAIGDPRMMLAWPGAVDVDIANPSSGNTVPLAPYLLAAQLGGMFCGGSIADPLTHRYITAQSLEVRLTRDDIDELLDAGVCPIEVVPNRGFRIVQSRSTWTADENFRNVEISCMRASDELVKRVRAAAEDRLVGRVISGDMLQSCVSVTQSVLVQAQRDGIIVGNPAYRGITATSNGDLVSIEFEAFLAIPANFIAITAHLQPFNGTTSAIV